MARDKLSTKPEFTHWISSLYRRGDELPERERAVYRFVLWSSLWHWDASVQVPVGRKFVAQGTGLTVGEVRGALDRLEEMGWLKSVKIHEVKLDKMRDNLRNAAVSKGMSITRIVQIIDPPHATQQAARNEAVEGLFDDDEPAEMYQGWVNYA